MTDTRLLREHILDVIAKDADVSRDRLIPEATLESLDLQSYEMVMILMGIEERFELYMAVDTELSEITTLGELLNLFEAKIKEHARDAASNADPRRELEQAPTTFDVQSE